MLLMWEAPTAGARGNTNNIFYSTFHPHGPVQYLLACIYLMVRFPFLLVFFFNMPHNVNT